MKYPVKLLPENNGFTATFPDVPEAIAHGKSYADVMYNAKDALLTALEFYREAGRRLPKIDQDEVYGFYIELTEEELKG